MNSIIHQDLNGILDIINTKGGITISDLNEVDEKGSNALFYSDVNKANFLLSLGIDANCLNNDNRNALFFSDYLTSITLVGCGVDFYHRDRKGLNIAEFIFNTYKNENKLINMKDKIKLCIRLRIDLSDKIHLTETQKKIVRECIEEIILEDSTKNIIENALKSRNIS